MRVASHRLLAIAVLAFATGISASAFADNGLKTYTKKGTYDDVRFELTTTIENRGLKIDYNGKIAAMLERTGQDVGSTKPVYKAGEFFTFCSAKLSRDMMEADPMNIGYCPYVMFVYETAANPGTVIVGYRKPPAGSGPAATAFKEIDTLLDGIAKDAIK